MSVPLLASSDIPTIPTTNRSRQRRRRVIATLASIAQFGLPIRVTEFNFPGQRSAFLSDHSRQMTPSEEEAKAKAITDYYRICFAHPAVNGILMWGFWEGANWIPASSLYKRDWTPTPAADAYHDLIYKKWWTIWQGKIDQSGVARVPAFYGTYKVTCAGQSRTVQLRSRDGALTVRF